MSDRELKAAIVQEMGGPADDPDEMTTLGFWLGSVGFSFDSRGPTIEMIEVTNEPHRIGRRRIGQGAIIATARRLLGIRASAAQESSQADAAGMEAIQLALL